VLREPLGRESDVVPREEVREAAGVRLRKHKVASVQSERHRHPAREQEASQQELCSLFPVCPFCTYVRAPYCFKGF
jgi:hypothetical protein